MDRIIYPAVFSKNEDGIFTVDFPDLIGCVTQGDNMQQAYEMAIDALGLYLVDMVDENLEIPSPSSLDEIEIEEGTAVVYIPFDYLEYKKKYMNRAVKKTLSIPEWLNDIALRENINFSQILQDALIEKLINAKS